MKNVKPDNDETLEIVVSDIEVNPISEDYHPVKLITNRGDIECRYYRVTDAQWGAIWVGGVGGGWDTPARGLYPRLCQELMQEGIASLQLRYRHSRVLEEAILDVLAGISYLETEGIDAIALIGHSFGGAVVIQAAACVNTVVTVVTLATQSYGAAIASQLSPQCSLLLLHGLCDRILSPSCSEYVYQIAHQPKHLILYPDTDHGLDEVVEEVYQTVRNWIIEKIISS